MKTNMVQTSIVRASSAPTPVVRPTSVAKLDSDTRWLQWSWFMLVLFAALPLSVLDLGWIVYAVETAADVYVFSTVLGSIANVASVRYLAFGIALIVGIWETRRRSEPWPAVHLALLGYALWAAASIAWSISPALAAIKVVALLASVLVSVALAARIDGIGRLIRATLSAVIVVMAVAIAVAAAMPDYGFDPYGNWYPRLGGQLIHPNELAQCAGMFIVLILGWPSGWSVRSRWSLAVMGAAVVAATQSRTTMLALIIAGAVWFLIRTAPAIRALSLGVGALAILALGIGELDLPGTLGYLERGSTERMADTIAQRVELWEYALEQGLGSLLVGQGFAVGSRIVLGPAFWWRPFHAHNLVLEILLNVGIVGVAIAGLATVLAVRSLLRLVRSGGDRSRQGAVGVTLLAFVVALGVTERSFGGELSSAVIAFVIAIAIAGVRLDQPAADHGGAAPARAASR